MLVEQPADPEHLKLAEYWEKYLKWYTGENDNFDKRNRIPPPKTLKKNILKTISILRKRRCPL